MNAETDVSIYGWADVQTVDIEMERNRRAGDVGVKDI